MLGGRGYRWGDIRDNLFGFVWYRIVELWILEARVYTRDCMELWNPMWMLVGRESDVQMGRHP